jgi:hypothetical protein
VQSPRGSGTSDGMTSRASASRAFSATASTAYEPLTNSSRLSLRHPPGRPPDGQGGIIKGLGHKVERTMFSYFDPKKLVVVADHAVQLMRVGALESPCVGCFNNLVPPGRVAGNRRRRPRWR